MGKIIKKYIGGDQVGSSQIELENNLSLRSMDTSSAAIDLLKLDASNLFQMVQHPYLPGPATAPEQAARQAEVDALDTRLTTAEGNITTLQSDVSTLQSDVSDLQAEDLTFLKLDGSRPMQANLNMMDGLVHYKIVGLADPQDPRDAANKQYVDAIAEGLHVHAPAQCLADSSLESITGGLVVYDNGVDGVGATLTLENALTIVDGYTLADTNRIIINGQSNQAYNGIYTIDATGLVLTRATDFDTPAAVAGGDFVFVQFGDTYGNTGWVEVDTTTAIGTSPISFIQFSGAGSYLAGDALFLDGNVFNVLYDGLSINVNGSNELYVMTDGTTIEVGPSGLQIPATYTAGFQDQIDTINGEITTIQSDISTIQGDITTINGEISTIQGDISTLQSDVSTLQGDVSNLQSEDLTFLKLDGSRPMEGNLNMNIYGIDMDNGAGATASYINDSITLLDDSSAPISYQTNIYSSSVQVVELDTALSQSNSVNMEATGITVTTSLLDLSQIQIGYGGGQISLIADVGTNAPVIPVEPYQVATKAYVDAQIVSGTNFEKEIIVLTGTDITNQYIDLANKYVDQSLNIGVGQRVNLYEGLDYSVSEVGGVTRLTITGPSATGGAEELVAGDTLYVQGVLG